MQTLFDLFGEKAPEQPKFQEKKNSKKKDTKKTEVKSKPSGEKKTVTSFNSPLSVFIGGNPECYILEKEGNITVADVKSFAESKISGYPSDLTEVYDLKNGVVVYLKGSGTEKGTITVSEGCRMYYGNIEIDISALVSEDLNLDLSKLNEVLKDALPLNSASYLYSKEKNLISLQVTGQPLSEITTPKGSIHVLLESGEELSLSVLSGPEQLSQIALPGFEVAETDTAASKKTKVELSKWLKKGEHLVHKHLQLISSTEKHKYFLRCHVPSVLGSAQTPAQETLYETENVTISLLWNRYDVSPECFNGKKQVSVVEILSYLVAQGNKEFEWLGKNDVSLQWNAKNRCILVSLKGSRKGADIAPFFLPKKIPFSIAAQWVYFSTLIYDKYKTEVLMDLYYDPKKDEYLWYVPKQIVSGATVNAIFEPFLQSALCGLKKIGQFHSHASFPAFFSGTDDQDEVIPGIYGVVGNIRKELSFKFRLIDVSGDKSELKYEELFSEEKTVDAEAIAPWSNHVVSHANHSQESPVCEEGFPMAVFTNGNLGLLLSSESEAAFIEHVDGFSVCKVTSEDGELFLAIPSDQESTSASCTITEQRCGLFEMY